MLAVTKCLRNYFSFDFGHRVSDFKKLTNENQFETEIRQLCELAIKKVTQYKDITIYRQSLGDKLLKLHSDKTNDWEKFHIGMAYGIAGHMKKAIDYLSKVSRNKYQLDWEKERATIAREYILALETGDFLTKINETIKRTKELKRVG